MLYNSIWIFYNCKVIYELHLFPKLCFALISFLEIFVLKYSSVLDCGDINNWILTLHSLTLQWHLFHARLYSFWQKMIHLFVLTVVWSFVFLNCILIASVELFSLFSLSMYKWANLKTSCSWWWDLMVIQCTYLPRTYWCNANILKYPLL